MANTPTTYYAINKPASGDTGWGTTMNANMDTIDTALQGMVQLAGRASGQTLYGDTAANGDLTLHGTSSATKTTSYVVLQPSGGNVGIGTSAPATLLDVAGAITVKATTDAALSAEYITDIQNRDFSAATDWTGTNWLIPLSSALTDVTVSASSKTFTRVSGSFITDGFQVGMSVTWSGFAKGGTVNNGTFVITTLTALVMTCSAATLSDEVPADYTSVTATSPVYSHAVAGANAATLANAKLTAAPANGTVFQITVTTVTVTANTLTFSIGGVAMNAAIGTLVQTRTAYVFNIVATGAGVFTITPGATWLGWIDNISVKVLTPATSVLSGKMQAGTTIIETRMPTTTSLGIGLAALANNIQVESNGFGYNALQNNTGMYSNGFGSYALKYNTGESSNGVGRQALQNNTGAYCNGVGYAALRSNTATSSNGFGYSALSANTGLNTNGFGHNALASNTGSYSNGFGYAALNANTGTYVNGFGQSALMFNTGVSNNGFGYQVLYDNTTGAGNSAFGHNAGRGFTDNNYSVFVGYDARTSAGTLTNAIVIGANARGTKSNQVTLGHTDVVETVLRGALLTSLSDSATSTTTTMLTIGHNNTGGTPAAGFGSRVSWLLNSSTTDDQTAAALDVAWSTATHASRASNMVWSLVTAATLAEKMRLTGEGNLKLGGTASRAGTVGTNHIDIFDGTAPTSTLANGVSLYSVAGKLWAMDSAGNATQLTP